MVADTRAHWYPLVHQALVHSLKVALKVMLGDIQWTNQDEVKHGWLYPKGARRANEADFRFFSRRNIYQTLYSFATADVFTLPRLCFVVFNPKLGVLKVQSDIGESGGGTVPGASFDVRCATCKTENVGQFYYY